MGLTQLEELNLSKCKILKLPDPFGASFDSLKVLNLSNNLMFTLPEMFSRMTALERLDMSYMRLISLATVPAVKIPGEKVEDLGDIREWQEVRTQGHTYVAGVSHPCVCPSARQIEAEDGSTVYFNRRKNLLRRFLPHLQAASAQAAAVLASRDDEAEGANGHANEAPTTPATHNASTASPTAPSHGPPNSQAQQLRVAYQWQGSGYLSKSSGNIGSQGSWRQQRPGLPRATSSDDDVDEEKEATEEAALTPVEGGTEVPKLDFSKLKGPTSTVVAVPASQIDRHSGKTAPVTRDEQLPNSESALIVAHAPNEEDYATTEPKKKKKEQDPVEIMARKKQLLAQHRGAWELGYSKEHDSVRRLRQMDCIGNAV